MVFAAELSSPLRSMVPFSRVVATLRGQSVQSGTAKTILICEDDENLRQLIRVVIGDGYRIVEAEDGDSALDLAREHRPDLIILDLMLPRLSGLEVLDRLRNEFPSDTTHIIVMSAWTHSDSAALAAGADRFIPKPFEAEELTEIVEEVLGEPQP
jgi:DNA-binding response OmpR family regulator